MTPGDDALDATTYLKLAEEGVTRAGDRARRGAFPLASIDLEQAHAAAALASAISMTNMEYVLEWLEIALTGKEPHPDWLATHPGDWSPPLGRIAAALERMADADERRNNLLVEDREERRIAWQRDAEERARVLAAIEERERDEDPYFDKLIRQREEAANAAVIEAARKRQEKERS